MCVCMIHSKFGWINARIIFWLGEGEGELVVTPIDSL